MRRAEELRQILTRIDGHGYKAYKQIEGAYEFPRCTLYIDHVQGDPFAVPSKIRIRVTQKVAGLPKSLFEGHTRQLALEDFLARKVQAAIRNEVKGRRGTGKSGLIAVDAGGQEVLKRTAVVLTPEWVETRLFVGLPAAGRRVLGAQAEAMLCHELPRIVKAALICANQSQQEAEHFVACVENQEHIRGQLDRLDLVAFIANGSILPRESGASDRPLPAKQAVAFQSPESLRVILDLLTPIPGPSGPVKSLTGMGIPNGVTLIVGGAITESPRCCERLSVGSIHTSPATAASSSSPAAMR